MTKTLIKIKIQKNQIQINKKYSSILMIVKFHWFVFIVTASKIFTRTFFKILPFMSYGRNKVIPVWTLHVDEWKTFWNYSFKTAVCLSLV